MSEYRENYFKARDIIAKELIEKHNLVESYREHDCLTLDSTNYSIHLTFVVPEGDDIYISEKGKKWYNGKSYKDFLFEKYPKDTERMEIIKKKYNGSSRKPHSFEKEEIKSTFQVKLLFLQKLFPEKFN